jgi:hypothetical protein
MLWGVLGGVFFLALLVVWVITVLDMVKRHLGAAKTAAWLVIVLVLPFVGSVLYWVLRKPTAEEIELQRESEVALREERHRRSFDSARTGL